MSTFWQAVWFGFSRPWVPVRQLFCRHHMYLEDLNRISDSVVTGICYKCKKVFVDTHGLAFGVQFERKPKPGGKP